MKQPVIQITTEGVECSMNEKVTPRRPKSIQDKNIEKLPICMTSGRGLYDFHVCLQPRNVLSKVHEKESFVLHQIIIIIIMISRQKGFHRISTLKCAQMRWHLHCGDLRLDFCALGPRVTQIPRDEGCGRQQSWGKRPTAKCQRANNLQVLSD